MNYLDHDPTISISETTAERAHCILIKIGNEKIYLHTRSAVDLNQKLSKAILDWIAKKVVKYHDTE